MWYYWLIPLVSLFALQLFFTTRNTKQWEILNDNGVSYTHYSELGFPDFGSSMTDAQTHINFVPRVYVFFLVLCAAALYIFPSAFKVMVYVSGAIMLFFAVMLSSKVSAANRVLKSVNRALYANYLPIKKILSYPSAYFFLITLVHVCSMALLFRSKLG